MSKRNEPRMEMTEERKRLFLNHLALTGSIMASCRAASPLSKHAHGAHSTFRVEIQRDPIFAAQVNEALEEAKAAVTEEIRRRGQEGYLEPVYQKGQRVQDTDPDTGKPVPASVRKFSDNLLLARARALLPEYRDKSTVEHRVTHSLTAGVQISSADLHALSKPQRLQLTSIIETIRDYRRGASDVPMIEHQPAEAMNAVDADFDVVSNDKEPERLSVRVVQREIKEDW